ncbi:MAG: TerB family tellurite resistance protein [Candidatus Methylomirabilota bacterium]
MVYNSPMLNRLKTLLAGPSGPEPPSPEARGRLAVASLMLALARSDDTYSPEEAAAIRHVLKDGLGVPGGELDALLAEADEARAQSIDLWGFTNSIKTAWPREERYRILVLLWRVVFADGALGRHEDHLMHALADLLGFSHRELIQAKLEAKEAPRP